MRWPSILRATDFGAALAFLTRLGSPLSSPPLALAPPLPSAMPLLARCVRCYGLVGLVVGVISTVPVWVWAQYGTPSPWLAGWLWALLGLWISRGLHTDGLADVADACGSGASGPQFWDILRDSRVGAFGVMALVLALSGLMLAAGARIAAEEWLALLLAPVYARCSAVILAFATAPHKGSSLGKYACAGATARVTCVHGILALACLYIALPLRQISLTLLLSFIALCLLRRTALRQGGINGDFLGAGIVCTELLFLLPF